MHITSAHAMSVFLQAVHAAENMKHIVSYVCDHPDVHPVDVKLKPLVCVALNGAQVAIGLQPTRHCCPNPDGPQIPPVILIRGATKPKLKKLTLSCEAALIFIQRALVQSSAFVEHALCLSERALDRSETAAFHIQYHQGKYCIRTPFASTAALSPAELDATLVALCRWIPMMQVERDEHTQHTSPALPQLVRELWKPAHAPVPHISATEAVLNVFGNMDVVFGDCMGEEFFDPRLFIPGVDEGVERALFVSATFYSEAGAPTCRSENCRFPPASSDQAWCLEHVRADSFRVEWREDSGERPGMVLYPTLPPAAEPAGLHLVACRECGLWIGKGRGVCANCANGAVCITTLSQGTLPPRNLAEERQLSVACRLLGYSGAMPFPSAEERALRAQADPANEPRVYYLLAQRRHAARALLLHLGRAFAQAVRLPRMRAEHARVTAEALAIMELMGGCKTPFTLEDAALHSKRTAFVLELLALPEEHAGLLTSERAQRDLARLPPATALSPVSAELLLADARELRQWERHVQAFALPWCIVDQLLTGPLPGHRSFIAIFRERLDALGVVEAAANAAITPMPLDEPPAIECKEEPSAPEEEVVPGRSFYHQTATATPFDLIEDPLRDGAARLALTMMHPVAALKLDPLGARRVRWALSLEPSPLKFCNELFWHEVEAGTPGDADVSRRLLVACQVDPRLYSAEFGPEAASILASLLLRFSCTATAVDYARKRELAALLFEDTKVHCLHDVYACVPTASPVQLLGSLRPASIDLETLHDSPEFMMLENLLRGAPATPGKLQRAQASSMVTDSWSETVAKVYAELLQTSSTLIQHPLAVARVLEEARSADIGHNRLAFLYQQPWAARVSPLVSHDVSILRTDGQFVSPMTGRPEFVYGEKVLQYAFSANAGLLPLALASSSELSGRALAMFKLSAGFFAGGGNADPAELEEARRMFTKVSGTCRYRAASVQEHKEIFQRYQEIPRVPAEHLEHVMKFFRRPLASLVQVLKMNL